MSFVLADLLPRTDWFRVLADLQRAGISQSDVSRMLGVWQSTVARWAEGNEPRHCHGEFVLELWCAKLGKARSEVPIVFY